MAFYLDKWEFEHLPRDKKLLHFMAYERTILRGFKKHKPKRLAELVAFYLVWSRVIDRDQSDDFIENEDPMKFVFKTAKAGKLNKSQLEELALDITRDFYDSDLPLLTSKWSDASEQTLFKLLAQI